MKIALPKGGLQPQTTAFLEKAGFAYEHYHESSRSYRPKSRTFPGLFTKVFHERDIAIQVAMGNYDVGISGLDWIEELLTKYHTDAIVKVRGLGYGQRELYLVTSRFSSLSSVKDVKAIEGTIRIVTEHPNLAEAFALRLRLRNFRIMPVWGGAEAYPPEHADLSLMAAGSAEELLSKGLIPIARLLSGNAWLIANRESMEKKDISPLLTPLCQMGPELDMERDKSISGLDVEEGFESTPLDGTVTMALADGHQQSHTSNFLKNAGIKVKGYRQPLPTRRPIIDLDGVSAKVIRPQDIPVQVANGNFDLAITGRDWLRNQLHQFPSSPVEEIADLGFGRVRIIVAVHNGISAENTADLRKLLQTGRVSALRIASEYTNIADKYARDNHLSPYKVIPTWGASEAFLPEDADVLIENTETGSTLAKNNLKIIDTLFESTGCLIANSRSLTNPAKSKRIKTLIERFNKGLS